MSAAPDDGRPRARTLFFGSGSFGAPILERLVGDPSVDVVGVVSAPDRPAGRRQALTASPAAELARDLGLPLLQPERLRSPGAVEEVAALRPELGVLADYGQIVPAALLDVPRHGILNVHPSLLPRHRGASPIPAAILAGDAETGVTIIRMDAGLDTGPILAATRWVLTGGETAPELEARAATAASELLGRTLGPWLRGEVAAQPQPSDGVSLTRPLRREDGRLDPSRASAQLERQVRAYQPWPGSFVETAAGRLIVTRARAGEPGGAAPGTFGPGPDLTLETADGVLILDEVQPAGGRQMRGAELLRGRSTLAGSSVV